MPAPRIITSVEDLTTRVNSSGTYNSAIVVASEKGPIDKAIKVSSQTDFLRKFTPDEKISFTAENSMHEAYKYLDQQNGLYVVRCAHIEDESDKNIVKSASTVFKKASSVSQNITQDNNSGSGLTYEQLKKLSEDINGDSSVYVFEDDEVCLFYGKDPGAYTNRLAVAVITDQSIVKQEGAFIVRVYKNGTLVETHTCSLDPTAKDGYGNNCYIETVLESSLYIRAAAMEENAETTAYNVTLIDTRDENNPKSSTCYMKLYHGASQELLDQLTDAQSRLKEANTVVTEKTELVNSAQSAYDTKEAEVSNKVSEINTINDEIATLEEELEQAETEEEAQAIQTQLDAKETELEAANNALLSLRAELARLETALTEAQTNLNNATELVNSITVEIANITEAINQANSDKNNNFEPSFGSNTFNIKTEVPLSDRNALDNITNPEANDVYPVKIIEDNETHYYYFIYDASISRWKKLQLFKTKYCIGELNDRASYMKTGKYVCNYGGTTVTGYETPKQSNKIGKNAYEPIYLRGGHDSVNDDGTSSITTADRIRALKALENVNDITIQLIMDGGIEDETYKQAIVDVCDKRDKSCHAILSTPLSAERDSDPLNKMQEFRNYDLNINNYSAELYTPHQKYYDEFNDRYLYLSPTPYVAALIMQTATERGWYWAAAGYNRGIVPSLDVAQTFDPTIVDEFSDMQINTIIKDPGAGNVIWDELTLWSQASDLQEAHISRYVNIYLRPRLKELLKSFLFEFNDEETRSLVTRKIDIFMQNQGRAIYAYRIVCDETNNLDDDIENNRLNAWLYIKPTKLAKEIRQKIILVPYGAELESLEI